MQTSADQRALPPGPYSNAADHYCAKTGQIGWHWPCCSSTDACRMFRKVGKRLSKRARTTSSKAERDPIERDRETLKGESRVNLSLCQSALGIVVGHEYRRCGRAVSHDVGHNLDLGACPRRQYRRLCRKLELILLRYAMGTGRRSVCQACAATSRRGAKGSRDAARSPVGGPVPTSYQAGPLRRCPILLFHAGLRIRHRRRLIRAFKRAAKLHRLIVLSAAVAAGCVGAVLP
jgi:hypothetical protein